MTTLRRNPPRRPFKQAAHSYRRKGWAGPLPLPPRAKEHPPTGWTGRGAPYPDDDQVDTWIAERPRANIAQRMGSVTADGAILDVIGIDVDDYVSGGKRKRGLRQLRALESEHVTLPPTWTSTARSDSKSGIRFFRAPAGLLWVGKAARDIDVISPGYRYAVVWPSIHPDGMIYRWYPPGTRPDGLSYVDEVPGPATLPVLPDVWIDFLTHDRMIDEGVEIDVESTDDGLMQWVRAMLPGHAAPPCARMRRDADNWLCEIADDPSSHDKVQQAHWNLLSNAVEGHAGWPAVVREVETAWLADVLARRKRSRSQAKAEIDRSKLVAFRKLKGDIDAHARDGIELVTTGCTCAVSITVTGRTYRPRGPRTPTRPRRYSA